MDNQKTDVQRETVGEWLCRPYVWRIPVYQRHYAWDAANKAGPIHLFWETVREQTVARLGGETPLPHYFGAVLVDGKAGEGVIEKCRRYDVVDGQQRLTTLQIALLALIRVAKEYGYDLEIKQNLAKYVFSDQAESKPRLYPTNFDKNKFTTVLFESFGGLPPKVGDFTTSSNKSKIDQTSVFLEEACKDLVRKNQQHKETEVIDEIMNTLLKGFDIVLIVLRENDEAQQIFESLNNFAEPLTTFDLIRNNIFYRAALADPRKDEKLFNSQKWQQLEQPYWEKQADKRNTTTNIEAYIARMLVAKMKKELLFNRNEIFKTYKEFSQPYSSVDEEIESLVSYTNIYKYLDSQDTRNPLGANADFGVFRHNVWSSRDFYPVIFLIVDAAIDAEEKQRMLRILESYVIRRGVCGLTHKHYNKFAASICADFDDTPSYEKLSEILKNAKGESMVFPDDKRVTEDSTTVSFYKSVFQYYVFEEIEKSMHSTRVERVIVPEGTLTIDHILPQKWETGKEWRNMVRENERILSEDDISKINTYHLHLIGNLTLMSGKNNTIKSNRPFEDVKDLLSTSELKLNRELAKEPNWTIDKILERSQNIATHICKIWPHDIA